MRTQIKVTFLSDWHISSGIGDGHLSDALLIRDSNGLPYIPGRALKGALREGARRLSLCPDRKDLQEAERYLWGSPSHSEESNFAGVLRLSAGRLPEALYDALHYAEKHGGKKEALIRDLTISRQQTALDSNGMVVKHSLRSIECGMAGLAFTATLDMCDNVQSNSDAHSFAKLDEAWLQDYFSAVCAATRSIGAHRSRGLGRCQISLPGYTKPICLPKATTFFAK